MSVANLSHVVSQKNKRFGPSDVSLRSGDFITIVNDDGNFVHQAYIETDKFAFDAGDIKPGASATIWFPRDGDFTVLCGIHPKMRLAVHVQG